MDDHKTIVEEDPARRGISLDVQTASTASLGLFLDFIKDGLELRRAFCTAQDKVIGEQGNILHIQQDDVGAQPFGNGFDNNMSEFDWFQDSTSVLLSFCRADYLSIRAS